MQGWRPGLASSTPMARARGRADEREPSELSRASLCFSISEAQASISLANLATSAEIAGSRAAAIARNRAALARRYAIGLRLALMAADCHAKALIYPKSSRFCPTSFKGARKWATATESPASLMSLSVHGLLTLVSYALAMERGIWLLAAFMVHKYGPEAPVYVERKLAEMQHQHDSGAHIAVWCQIARAVLAIIEPTPAGPRSVH
jgi:hypothetical protein